MEILSSSEVVRVVIRVIGGKLGKQSLANCHTNAARKKETTRPSDWLVYRVVGLEAFGGFPTVDVFRWVFWFQSRNNSLLLLSQRRVATTRCSPIVSP